MYTALESVSKRFFREFVEQKHPANEQGPSN
jgi:hypothetical protein